MIDYIRSLINTPVVIGLVGVSMILGTIATPLWYRLLTYLTRCTSDELNSRTRSATGCLTGLIERVFFTVCIAAELTGVAGALVAWIAIKAQAHYQIFTRPQADLPRLYRALLSSLGSMFFAVLGGWIWRSGFTF